MATATCADARDHSACGVGLVARISGEPDREVVGLALGALAAMEHRGGVGADGDASDGAGVLTAIPWRVLEPWLAEQRLTEPRPFSTAVGMVFLPREPGKRTLARELVAKALRDEGLVVVGWREVPLRPEALPTSVRERHPHVEQVVAQSPTLAGDELERALLLARRAVGRALLRQPVIRRLDDLYICSLSSRTVVYKGMVTAQVLPEFYPDLQDPAFVSHFAVLHRRFSTNTAPKWSLAQPMRLLAHNGEINTLLGNLAWMRAREPELAGQDWGARIVELLPVVHGDSSDSGALDKFVELLVRSGRSPLEALMMAMPAAGTRGDPRVAEFYDYYAGVQEAWDGPALVAFADGLHAGACVDRNGLRPARYARTRSGLLALASEAGAVELPGEDVVEKGRLGPGQMIAVQFEHGRLLRDDVVKTSVASRRPYGSWLLEQRRTLAARPFGVDGSGLAADDLLRRQAAAGFTAEDVELIVRPMARHAKEPRFSMGNDAPLPVLSGKPHVLYDYFTERFAQVTNPAIDPLRERLVMSLAVRLGPRGDLLASGPEHARQVDLASPVLNTAEMEALPAHGLPTARVSTAYEVASGPWGLREAVERVCREAAAAVRDGAEVVVLSDRAEPATAETAHAPALLAVGAVHHDLIRRGLRSRASLVAETAQCWSVHHFACLIGYGASAVHPYLALETVRDLWERGRLTDDRPVAPSGPARLTRPGRSGGGPPSLPRLGRGVACSRSSPRWASRCWPATTAPSSSRRSVWARTSSTWRSRVRHRASAASAWRSWPRRRCGSTSRRTPSSRPRSSRTTASCATGRAASTTSTTRRRPRRCAARAWKGCRTCTAATATGPRSGRRRRCAICCGWPATPPRETAWRWTTWSGPRPSCRGSARAACRSARSRARRTRPSPSPWRASMGAPTPARAGRTPGATR